MLDLRDNLYLGGGGCLVSSRLFDQGVFLDFCNSLGVTSDEHRVTSDERRVTSDE